MSFKTATWQTAADDVTRAMPHAVGCEKSVLSTMLQDPAEFIPLAMEDGITERHFYMPSHSTLFTVLVEQFSAGKTIELIGLIQCMIDRGLLDRVGGPSGLTDIYTYAAGNGMFRAHMAELVKKFAAREMLRVANETIAAVYNSPDEVPETLETMEKSVMAIRDMDGGDKPQTVKQAVVVVMDRFKAEINKEPSAKGMPTGYDELDRMTGGLKAGEMFIVGARPSVGKTSFMMNVVEHVCLEVGIPTLVFSAEMTTDAVTKRLIFARSKFALGNLSRGYVANKGDLQRIQRAALEVSASKLYLDDKSGPTIGYIAAKARRMKREYGIGFIAIDYLGLIKSLSKQSQFSREREISEISAGIKGMAKDLMVPVLLLAQLSRDVEKRSGKGSAPARPRLSDLRDSGSIEQDADIVGLLSRADYQNEDGDSGVACLDLAKNRNGATGPIPLTFIADLMRFESGAPYRDGDDGGRFGK